MDLNQTAYNIAAQIRGFSFREYQLPSINDCPVVNFNLSNRKSIEKPGSILFENEIYFDIATIDYDIKIYKDRITELDRFSCCNLDEGKAILKGLKSVHDRNEKGCSPIIIAAYHGNLEVVDFLLKNNADVNDTNYNGTSVLMYAKKHALKWGNKNIFDLLLTHGANIKHRDYNNKNLLDYLSDEEKTFLNVENV